MDRLKNLVTGAVDALFAAARDRRVAMALIADAILEEARPMIDYALRYGLCELTARAGTVTSSPTPGMEYTSVYFPHLDSATAEEDRPNPMQMVVKISRGASAVAWVSYRYVEGERWELTDEHFPDMVSVAKELYPEVEWPERP